MKDIKEYIIESSDQKIYTNMIVVSPDDKILILRRANYMKKFGGKWGFPGGSFDKKDKDSKAGAIRELYEETGIKLTWNEEHNCKKFETIKNEDGSLSEYYVTTLETSRDVKISREHAKYEWFDESNKNNHKWMPDVFQLIQKYYDK